MGRKEGNMNLSSQVISRNTHNGKKPFKSIYLLLYNDGDYINFTDYRKP